MQGAADVERARALRTTMLAEAGAATASVQDALIFLTSVFKLMAVLLVPADAPAADA